MNQTNKEIENSQKDIKSGYFGEEGDDVLVYTTNQTNNRIREIYRTGDLKDWENLIAELLKSQREDLMEKKCEHNMIPFTYVGAWGGSNPPPNMKCTKCLIETRF